MKKSTWYEHLTPLFLAIFPVLSLALTNIEFVKLNTIVRSLLISVAATALFYLIFYLILKEPKKTGVLAGVLTLLLLTYGNVYLFLQERFGESLEHPLLIALYAVLVISAGVFLKFGVKDARELNRAIFTGSLVIVIYLLGAIGFYKYRLYRSEQMAGASSAPFASVLTGTEIASLPDIYLILLDGHTRSDVLRDIYKVDNSKFIGEIEELGFQVAECAHSNYPATNFSTAAMFEMEYLHDIYQNYDNLVLPSLNNTAVFQILKDHGYSTVTFSNFVFDHFNIKDDIRLSKDDKLFGSINEFEDMLVDTSILRLLGDLEGVFPDAWVQPFTEDLYLGHYRDTNYALEILPQMPEMNQRKFVYAHLLVTHDPFVFMPDGSFNPSEKITAQNYGYTVEYIDRVLPGILEEIIAGSETPPLIIVMGDHGAPIKGTPIEERLAILYAVYYQGEELGGFYEELSPVNLFRLIFNQMLGADLDLIEDSGYDIWNKTHLGDTEESVVIPCSP